MDRGGKHSGFSQRLKRLAGQIDALTAKDERNIHHAREIASLRRQASVELHGTCAEFVRQVNQFLTGAEMTLDPPEFFAERFQEEGTNLFQINIRGRILQIEFGATEELMSTEDFRVPYILEGLIHAFNQELLEKNLIEEQLLFFTVEDDRRMWRFFDARTYRSGPFDLEYLLSLMERLL
ncbi:MAG TPA: hypothetical protein VG675_18460 [Bryobacteraceae bacterium]|nr:hypothetical protein [Bryobacteraceae bacterium]